MIDLGGLIDGKCAMIYPLKLSMEKRLQLTRQVDVPTILSAFPSSNFNMDKTGLFWKILPSGTMSYWQEQVRGGKVCKDRITIEVGPSMEGKHLPLLVVGMYL